jgi:hypothetical protein
VQAPPSATGAPTPWIGRGTPGGVDPGIMDLPKTLTAPTPLMADSGF